MHTSFAPDAAAWPARRGFVRMLLAMWIACGSGFWHHAQAAEPAVSARFAENEGEVGVPMRFDLQVTGTPQYVQVPQLQVDGLDFRYMGAQRVRVRSTGTISVVHAYQVIPKRAGTFTVPPLEVEIEGGQVVRTEPAMLTVRESGAGGGGHQTSGAPRAEIVLEKTTCYVGELVPLDFQISFSPQMRPRVEERPVLSGEGFTKTKFDDGETTQSRIHFRAVVTPARAGTVQIGPGSVPVGLVVPMLGGDEEDSFFGGIMRGFGRVERRELSATAAELMVKPLPAAGRPKLFGGAVGQFQIAMQNAPAKAKLNEPMTLKVVVTGKGNFERVTAPQLAEPQGWRVYEPMENLVTDDARALRGTKTFEIAVVPEAKQERLPVFEFAYFDPVAEKYVSLKTAAAPLAVEGVPLPPLPTVAGPAGTDRPALPASTPAPLAAPKDILGIKYEAGEVRARRVLYQEPLFLALQAVPLSVLLGVWAARARRPKSARPRLAALRKERAALAAQLRREQDRRAFYETAARLVQVEAALRTGREPATVDAAFAQGVTKDAGLAEVVGEIFETRAEALYAGAAEERGRVSGAERERVLGAVSTLGKATT